MVNEQQQQQKTEKEYEIRNNRKEVIETSLFVQRIYQYKKLKYNIKEWNIEWKCSECMDESIGKLMASLLQ